MNDKNLIDEFLHWPPCWKVQPRSPWAGVGEAVVGQVVPVAGAGGGGWALVGVGARGPGRAALEGIGVARKRETSAFQTRPPSDHTTHTAFVVQAQRVPGNAVKTQRLTARKTPE